MPIYIYRCDDCEEQKEEYHRMEENLEVCPNCDSRTYHRIPCNVHTELREFYTPIVMHSVGFTDQQSLEDFSRNNPGIQMSTDPRDDLYGVPVAKNRSEKKQILKSVGFVEMN